MKIIDRERFIIKEYWLAIVIAMVVAFIYFAPYFLSLFENEYKGVLFTSLDSEVHYLARLNEISEGYWNYASTYLYEYKDSSTVVNQYSDVLYGLIVGLLGISVVSFYLFAKIFFAFLNYLLWYFLSYLLSNNKKFSILTALFVTIGYTVKENINITDQINILFWKGDVSNFLVFSRIVNPLVVHPFFIISIILLFLFFKKNQLKYSIWFGVLLGLNYYLFFYSWVYLLVVAFLLILYFVIYKKFDEVKKLACGLFLSFVLGVYYFYMMFKLAFFSFAEDATAGALSLFESTHEIILSKYVFFIFLIFLVYLIYKKVRIKDVSTSDIFLLLLISGSIIVVNQQVLTGMLVEEGHFHWYINTPITSIVLAYLIYYTSSFFKKKSLNIFVFSFFLIYFIFFGLGYQLSAYGNVKEEFIKKQRYAEFYEWLNKNSDFDSVVMTNGSISNSVPAYTHNNVYFSEYIKHYSSTPFERRVNAFYVNYILEKCEINCDNLDYSASDKLMKDWVYFKYLRGRGTEVPVEIKDAVFGGCQNYDNRDFYDILNEYRLDYILWDKDLNPGWEIDKYDFVEEIYNKNNIFLYKII